MVQKRAIISHYPRRSRVTRSKVMDSLIISQVFADILMAIESENADEAHY